MKMQNKKRGFTIVELVIVIAVIGILAGVLVPTFTGIVNKAKKSAALQEATSAYHMLLGEEGAVENNMYASANDPDLYIAVDGTYFFEVEDGVIDESSVTAIPDGYTPVTMIESVAGVVVYKK